MDKKAMREMVYWAAVLTLSAGVLAAQEPAKFGGTWEMTMEGRQGPTTQTLTIQQTADKIKGTIKGARGETPFEGTVKGNKISFTVKRETPRGEMTMEYTGTIEGDSIKGTMQAGEFSREWSAKRAKEKE